MRIFEQNCGPLALYPLAKCSNASDNWAVLLQHRLLSKNGAFQSMVEFYGSE